MDRDFFDKARKGGAIDLVNDRRFHEICLEEIKRSRQICFFVNSTYPTTDKYRELLGQLFCRPLEADTVIEAPVQVDYGCQVNIGKNLFIGNHYLASAFGGIDICDNAMVGFGCAIATVNHELANLTIARGKGVRIENGAWLGAKVTIVPGVTIGKGAVVGAGSVVTKDVPAYAVAVGNPARVIKFRGAHEEE